MEKRFRQFGIWVADDEQDKYLDVGQVVVLLNEQQATISQLAEENEQLRQQLKQKQEEEQLYADEIVKLNKENKEVLNFKKLGGNYWNVRRLRFLGLPISPNIPMCLYGTRIHNNTTGGIMPLKKYTIRCPYCGATTTKWEWLLKLFLLTRNTYTHHCTVCHHKSVWINIFHLRHDSTNKNEQIFNKGKLFDDRI